MVWPEVTHLEPMEWGLHIQPDLLLNSVVGFERVILLRLKNLRQRNADGKAMCIKEKKKGKSVIEVYQFFIIF